MSPLDPTALAAAIHAGCNSTGHWVEVHDPPCSWPECQCSVKPCQMEYAIRAYLAAAPDPRDAEIARLKERDAEFSKLSARWAGENGTLIARLIDTDAEIARLREALGHYAKDYDYATGCSQWDGGVTARAALEARHDR